MSSVFDEIPFVVSLSNHRRVMDIGNFHGSTSFNFVTRSMAESLGAKPEGNLLVKSMDCFVVNSSQ